MRSIAAIVAVVVGLGCGGPRSSKPPPEESHAAVGTGDEGAVMVAVWPAHWARLDAMLATMPPPARELFAWDVAQLRSPWSLLRALGTQTLGISLPEELPGFDARRPIVVSAFAPTSTFETIGAALAATFKTKSTALPPAGVRHRVSIPASDPKAMVAALRAALTSLPALDDTTFGDGERLIGLTAGASTVSISIVMGSGLGTIDAATRDALLGGRGEWTPRLHALLADPEPAVARAHFRLDKLADAGTMLGISRMARWLVEDGRPAPVAIFAAGYSELLTAPLMMDPATMMVSDVVVDLPAADRFAPATYVVPTEAGRAALAGDAALATGKPMPLVDLDPAAIARNAKLPAVAGDGAPQDVGTLVHQCGAPCFVWLGLGNGMRLLEHVDRSDVREMITNRVSPDARATLLGGALLVEAFGTAGAGPVKRARALRPTRIEPSPGSRCYAAALLALRDHMQRASGSMERAGEILGAFTTAQRSNLDCAAADPALAARVTGIRDMVGALRDLSSAAR